MTIRRAEVGESATLLALWKAADATPSPTNTLEDVERALRSERVEEGSAQMKSIEVETVTCVAASLVGRFAMGFVGALAALSGVCCGGDGGSCSTPMACGGDIVGTWTVTSSCVHFTGPIGDSTCPAATLDATLEYSGTVSYTAAMTYTQDVTASGSETIVIPASCLGVSCAQADQMFQSSPPAGTTSIHCATAGSGCNCTAVLSSDAITDTGTYTLSGTGVTTTSSAGDIETDQYCVMGNHLDIMPGPNSGSPGATASGSIALTKQ